MAVPTPLSSIRRSYRRPISHILRRQITRTYTREKDTGRTAQFSERRRAVAADTEKRRGVRPPKAKVITE